MHLLILRTTVPGDPKHLSALRSDGYAANLTGLLAVTDWARSQSSAPDSDLIDPNATFEAGRCYFYMAVREVSAQVLNGMYSGQVVQEYTLYDRVLPNGTLYNNIAPYYYHTSFKFRFQHPFAKAPSTNLQDTFCIDLGTWTMLSQQLVNIFSGDVTWEFYPIIHGPDMLRLLYEAGNTTRAMYNAAKYMNIAMRVLNVDNLRLQKQDPSLFPPEQIFAGTVWIYKQFDTVRWEWLALPGLLLAFAIVVLITVILQTLSNRVGLWHSSPLTLFFHGQLTDRFVDHTWESRNLTTANKMQDARCIQGPLCEIYG